MPRKVSSAEISQAIAMMEQGIGQRDIERQTGLSRPYLRKIARQIGFQFPRNGVEVLGKLCMCCNCGSIFRKPPSKVERAKRQFCDADCRESYFKGSLHSSWTGGESAKSFSSWIKNQSSYNEWRSAVLERDGNKCVISGRTDNLEAHHILLKSNKMEESLNIENGLTLNKEIHTEMHQLIRQGYSFEDCIVKLKEKYDCKEQENRI